MNRLIYTALLLAATASTISYDGEYFIDISHHQPPSYTLTLPSRLDVTDRTTSFDYHLEGDIYNGTSIVVDISDLVLSSGTKAVAPTIRNEKSSFSCQEIAEGATGKIDIVHDELSAGEWHGTLNLVISLQKD